MALGRRPFILFTFPCKLKQTSWRQEMNFQLVPIAEAAVFFLAAGYRKRLLFNFSRSPTSHARFRRLENWASIKAMMISLPNRTTVAIRNHHLKRCDSMSWYYSACFVRQDAEVEGFREEKRKNWEFRGKFFRDHFSRIAPTGATNHTFINNSI